VSRVSELREKAQALRSEAYRLKTKKAQMKRYEQARAVEREAIDLLYAQLETFGPHTVKATVKTFHPGDDNFLVETPYETDN
jgi:hypothetical protein